MKLYYYSRSHNSRRVLALIRHLGIAVELDHRELSKGEHKTPEITALNPNGLLPILVDGDFVLFESNAIMQYLSDKHGPTELYPADLNARAKVNQWLSWQMCHLSQTTGPYVFENLVKPLFDMGEPDTVRLDKVAVDFKKYVAVLDGQLGNQTFVTGDHLTLADFSIASNLMYADIAKMPWQDFANVRAWYARVAALDSWIASEPKH